MLRSQGSESCFSAAETSTGPCSCAHAIDADKAAKAAAKRQQAFHRGILQVVRAASLVQGGKSADEHATRPSAAGSAAIDNARLARGEVAACREIALL